MKPKFYQISPQTSILFKDYIHLDFYLNYDQTLRRLNFLLALGPVCLHELPPLYYMKFNQNSFSQLVVVLTQLKSHPLIPIEKSNEKIFKTNKIFIKDKQVRDWHLRWAKLGVNIPLSLCKDLKYE